MPVAKLSLYVCFILSLMRKIHRFQVQEEFLFFFLVEFNKVENEVERKSDLEVENIVYIFVNMCVCNLFNK